MLNIAGSESDWSDIIWLVTGFPVLGIVLWALTCTTLQRLDDDVKRRLPEPTLQQLQANDSSQSDAVPNVGLRSQTQDSHQLQDHKSPKLAALWHCAHICDMVLLSRAGVRLHRSAGISLLVPAIFLVIFSLTSIDALSRFDNTCKLLLAKRLEAKSTLINGAWVEELAIWIFPLTALPWTILGHAWIWK